MVKRAPNVAKKEKKQKTYHEGKSPIRIKEDQIGKKYVSVFSVTDGQLQFNVTPGDDIIVLRYQYGTPGEWHPGVAREIEDDGTVKFWDETLEQWLYFNWKAENVPAVLRKNV